MTIPVFCRNCGEMIGEVPGSSFDPEEDFLPPHQRSIIPCNHPKPEITETINLFGLVKKKNVYYPEVGSEVCSEEYLGPSNKLLLWLAIVFGTSSRRAILVADEWAFWDYKAGFYGDGMQKLQNVSVR